jgi:hypothetical protein
MEGGASRRVRGAMAANLVQMTSPSADRRDSKTISARQAGGDEQKESELAK